MNQEKLFLYTLDMKYIRDLHQMDARLTNIQTLEYNISKHSSIIYPNTRV